MYLVPNLKLQNMKTKSTPSAFVKLAFSILFVLPCLLSMATNHVITFQNFFISPDSLNVMVGDTITFTWSNGTHTTTSTSVPGGAASWNANLNSSSPTYVYVPTVPGTYRYQCNIHTTMQGVLIVSGLTDVAKIDKESPLMIYPRPFTNTLTVDLNYNNSFLNNVTIDIYNILGEKKYSRYIGDNVIAPVNIDLSTLPGGVYFVSVHTPVTKATYKITKAQ